MPKVEGDGDASGYRDNIGADPLNLRATICTCENGKWRARWYQFPYLNLH